MERKLKGEWDLSTGRVKSGVKMAEGAEDEGNKGGIGTKSLAWKGMDYTSKQKEEKDRTMYA